MWLRTATDKDLAAIRSFLIEIWHTTYDDLLGHEPVSRITAQWHSPERLSTYLSQPSSEYIVADDGGKICGVAYARHGGIEGKPDTVFLHQLYVHPEVQKQGIGKQLLAEIEDCFPDARRIELDVLEKNSCAIQFYTRQGYRKISGPAPFSGYQDINTITMAKELS